MIYLYNTLSRKKEKFVPLEANIVKIYSCGLTVNNFAHIGHGVAYIMMDTLVKMFRLNGFDVDNVMNITDVGHLTSDEDEGDDKIEKAAKREGKDAYAIAEFYTEYFLNFLEKLNVNKPKHIAKATNHIQDMIDFVVELEAKGFAYKTSDGVYFDISKFKEYGKLSGKRLNDLKAGARVEINSEKRNPQDFALWKKVSENTLMKWKSPFFEHGCPGWHIECSAMSHKYLGEHYDIHTGGVDHIPVHHENEIAQSECFYGFKTVNYWLHCEFLKVNGGKMSKSLGNCYKLEDLEKMGYSPLDFRFLCLNASYRKPMNFTFEALDGAKNGRIRLYEILLEHKNGEQQLEQEKIESYKTKFIEVVSDDLSIAEAIGNLWTILKTEPKSGQIYDFALYCDQVLSLNIKEEVEKLEKEKNNIKIPKEIIVLANERLIAKQNKNYALADELRGTIEALGYSILDNKTGFEIVKR